MTRSLTPADLANARSLMAVREARMRERARLQARLGVLQRQADASAKLFQERLDFRRHPERLAGLAEFTQRQHPKTRRNIEWSYRACLKEMIDPFRPLEPGMPTPKPRTIDMHALPVPARPYLIGPFLGLHHNHRFAEVDLLQSRPASGHMVYLQTGGPVDIEQWRAHLPAINAWLNGNASSGAWTVTAHTASSVTLTRHVSLPATIAFDRRMLAPGALFVGIDTVQRRPVHIPFADLTAGTYLPGASGSGKTSALHILLRSIFANLDLFSAVWLVDGKDGVALNRYANIHPKVRVLYEEPDVWKLAADLCDLMKVRNAEQRARGVDKATKDFVAVVIDELPTFVAKPPKDAKKDHDAFLDNLQRIAMRGRSAGIRMFLITQAPVSEQIPVPLRTNCGTTIAFRLPENAHATALFGTLTPSNDPRKLTTGQAVVLQADAGKLTTVQFPFAPLYQPPR